MFGHWNLAHNLVSFNYRFGVATVAIIIIIIYCPIPANYHHNFYHPLERISIIAVAVAAAASVAAIIIILLLLFLRSQRIGIL